MLFMLLDISRLQRTITSDIVVRFHFASDLCTISNFNGYVIKQLVHAFNCALSSDGALGKFGELSSNQLLSDKSILAAGNSYSPNFLHAP